MNIVKTLLENCDQQKAAFIIDDKVITYKNLLDQTEKYIYYFKTQKFDSSVLIFLPESLEFISAVLACWCLDIPIFHPNPFLSKKTIEKMCKDTNTKFIITNNDYEKKLRGINAKIIDLGSAQMPFAKHFHHDYPIHDSDKEIFYAISTGSTGESKLVPHTINNILAWSKIYSNVCNINKDSIIYTTSRMTFIWGFACSLFLNLYQKSTCIIDSKMATPKLMKHNIETYKPTHFFTVPTFVDLLIKSKLDVDFSSVDLCMSSGDWLPEHFCHEFATKFNKTLVNAIGSSETVSNYTFTATHDTQNINSLGKPIESVQIKIMENETECKIGEVGEIYVSAPFNSTRYLNHSDALTYENGWIKTKDLGYFNSNGSLVYMGRKNFIFKIHGQFVNPIEVEKEILTYPGIENCIVKSVTKKGHLPKLAVDLLCSKNIDIADLKIYLGQKLEKINVPKIYNIVEKINTTWNGKKLRTIINAL
jgi:benzoate-CoA ligase|tara:strand:- start:1153 stop:2583 length:1431 start_codon:yes stop_codon:yes gene_type:complete